MRASLAALLRLTLRGVHNTAPRPQSRTPKELEARFKQLVRLIEKELETEDQVRSSPAECV
jgi:hypothetical protein